MRRLGVIIVVKYILFGHRYRAKVNIVSAGGAERATHNFGSARTGLPHCAGQDSKPGQDSRFAGVVWADKDVKPSNVKVECAERFEPMKLDFHKVLQR
jgi:hypothetical protein